MSHFQKPLCYLLFETGKEDLLMYYCDNLLKINPNNYYSLLYKGVLEMKKDQVVHAKQIAENLIKLKPNKFEGYILKSACLIVNNEIDEDGEYIDAFIQQYRGSSIYFLLISKSMFRVGIFVFLEGKFDNSYEALEKIPVSYFEYKQNKLYLQLIILMHKQDYEKVFQKLIEEYENSQLFYQVIYEEFCQSLNQFNLNEKAFLYIQQQQGNLQDFHFINFIMGKSLFELKRHEEALKYFNEYSHDSCALPYVQYFKGLTLLELDLFEEAATCFECALKTKPGFNLAPHNFYFHKIVCEIMFGDFKKAQEYNLNCCAQSTLKIFFQGFLQYILGKTKEAQDILKDAKLNQEFPLVSFLQSKNLSTLGWIMEEKKIVGATQYFQNMAYCCEPQLQQFKNKFSFFTNGPYSKYIMKNQALFDNYDDSMIPRIILQYKIYGHIY